MEPTVVKTADEMAEALGLPVALESDNRNHWAKELGAATYDAGRLLDIMRPEVEKVLVTAGIFSPTSQTIRVRECIERMEAQCEGLRISETMAPEINFKQRMHLNKMICMLKDFQSVLRTVWILEGKPGVH